MRIGFAGTPAFAAVALDHLLDAGHTVSVVLTQPDRPAGRGQRLQASAVKQRAIARAVPVLQPQGLRLDGRYAQDAQATQQALAAMGLDAMVVVAYGLILPAWVLTQPRLGCFNIHGSLLPRWRGAAPIQRAVEAGDARTGITIIQMDAGLDTGDMLAIEAIDIGPEDTAQTLHDRLAPLGARLMAQVLQQAATSSLVHTPQPAEGACYAPKIDKQEAAIDWTQSAQAIERRLRAFDPFPGCHMTWQDEPLKVWRAAAQSARGDAAPGTVRLDGASMVVRCGEGELALLEVQRAGGRRQPVASFLAARSA